MMAQKRVDGLLVMCSEYPDSGIEHAGRVPPYPDGGDGLGRGEKPTSPMR